MTYKQKSVCYITVIRFCLFHSIESNNKDKLKPPENLSGQYFSFYQCPLPLTLTICREAGKVSGNLYFSLSLPL